MARKTRTGGSSVPDRLIRCSSKGRKGKKYRKFRRLNSILETTGIFYFNATDVSVWGPTVYMSSMGQNCKRMGTRRLHEFHESKLPFVLRIELIRFKSSYLSAHVSGVSAVVGPPLVGLDVAVDGDGGDDPVEWISPGFLAEIFSLEGPWIHRKSEK